MSSLAFPGTRTIGPTPALHGSAPARGSVLDRLAAWAERQPACHRQGQWTLAIAAATRPAVDHR